VTASLSVVATRTGTITATVPVGDGSFDVALAPDGRSAYVAVLGPGNVSAISTHTHRVSETVKTLCPNAHW
jgi:DNA-binding beta-propeller fold protein YncE